MSDRADPNRRASLARLLSQGPFAIYTWGNGVSLIGTWMQRMACGWLVWEWTQSAFWLGVLAAADLMPTLVIGPFAGAAADRWSRLTLNRLGQLAMMALSILMGALLFADALGLSGLLLLATAQGSLVALCQPARLALVNELLPRADVPMGVALSSVNVNLARLIGPAVAGVMILQVDIFWVFVVNVAFTAAFIFALGLVRTERRPPASTEQAVLPQIAEGFRHVLADPPLRIILIILLLGGSLVRSIGELLPAFAAQSFSDDAKGLAMLTSAMGLGAVVAGLTVGSSRSIDALFRSAIACWSFGAVAAVLFGISFSAWLAVGIAVVLGHLMSRGLIATQTFVQLTTPDAMRGRVLSVHGLIARGSPSLGALAIGAASDEIGLPWAVTVTSLLFGIAVAILAPSIRRVRPEIEAANTL